MTKEVLQQALDALTNHSGNYKMTKAECDKHSAACEALEDALAQQDQPNERDGIPEWTPNIGVQCAISSLREDAIRLRDGSYSPQTVADDLDVIINDLGKCLQGTTSPDLTQDLAMMIRRLILSVRRLAEDESKDRSLANSFASWLRNKGLAGSPLREDVQQDQPDSNLQKLDAAGDPKIKPTLIESRSIAVLNTVKLLSDDGRIGLPVDLRMSIEAILMTAAQRREGVA